MNPDLAKILDMLPTFTAKELRIILDLARDLDARYKKWEDPYNHQTEHTTNGTYVQERVKCGKSGCKGCSQLGGHGPYWYWYYSEGGKTRKKYIGKHKPTAHPHPDDQPPP
jgi:uncharacterized protein (DUF2147 family)